jgi:hypothetical protein
MLGEEVREMKKMSEWIHTFLYSAIVFCAAGLLLLIGCGENPLSTENEIDPGVEILSKGMPKLKSLPDELSNRGIYTRRIVGPKGGTVHCWHHSLTIPSGALQEKAWVSVSWENRSLPILDFASDGLEYLNDQPAVVRISYKGGIFGNLNEDKLYIREWDKDRDGWVKIGGIVNKKMKYVEVYVTRLSRYALSDR